eukprot:3852288-Pyramimonas_sp.AAC.1
MLRPSKAITCRGGAGNTAIDYFALNTAANRAFSDVRADMLWSRRHPRPVLLYLKGTAASMRKLVYSAVPSLGKKGIVGPQPEPPRWRVARSVTDAARQACCDESVGAITGGCILSRAWALFASLAARQIGGVTGSSALNYCAFCKPLQARWAT